MQLLMSKLLVLVAILGVCSAHRKSTIAHIRDIPSLTAALQGSGWPQLLNKIWGDEGPDVKSFLKEKTGLSTAREVLQVI